MAVLSLQIRRPSLAGKSSLSFRQPPPQLLGALLCLSSSSSLSCFSSFTLLYSLFTEEIEEVSGFVLSALFALLGGELSPTKKPAVSSQHWKDLHSPEAG
ncbi:uncharacterized protein G2W53_021982 [Senna tora]|uniref:Uncharacterized protein n=1 Tax=Senna tora TaxID=362788 RepID=A0A834TKH7_9FABA|nr:uncharacterized protein G2W53_021982 [Senna tora]